ncbi:MAG TPA: septation protein A [Methyloradius sp.]
MKFLFDLFPVILFFGVFKWAEGHGDAAVGLISHYFSSIIPNGTVTEAQAPILLATGVAILASLAQIGWLLVRKHKIDGMLWVSLAIIVIFGGATIYFRDDTFIKWKPTILYWCFAMGLLGSYLFFGKNLIRSMMEKQIALPDAIWKKLNVTWVVFFLVMGIINLYVAFNYSLNAWVNFKLFGGMGLMFVFVIVQSLFLSKYMKDAE